MALEEQIRDYAARNTAAELECCPDPMDDLLGCETEVYYDFGERPGVVDIKTESKTYRITFSVAELL